MTFKRHDTDVPAPAFCCLLLHPGHLLHLSPTAPAALAPYCTCGTCLLQHLDHMLSLPHQLKAGGWADCFLFFVFQFHIMFRRRAADPFFFQHKGNKENSQHLPTTPQRAHLLHLGHLLHVPPTAPVAPAAPASYCTYGTCCTCLLLGGSFLLIELACNLQLGYKLGVTAL